MSPLLYGKDIMPTADGVGVKGGALLPLLCFVFFDLLGVDGGSGFAGPEAGRFLIACDAFEGAFVFCTPLFDGRRGCEAAAVELADMVMPFWLVPDAPTRTDRRKAMLTS